MAKNKEYEKRYKEEGRRRIKLRKEKCMKNFIIHPNRWKCDMDYDECNLRGYCNGDC